MVYVFIEIMHYETGVADANCKNYPLVWPMYFHLVFIVVQTFFIFKGVSVATNLKTILSIFSNLLKMLLPHSGLLEQAQDHGINRSHARPCDKLVCLVPVLGKGS